MKALTYALLVATDYMLTRVLITRLGAYEVNPVADWILTNYGWNALAWVCVGVVCAVCTLSRLRPWLLSFACFASSCVVAWNAYLLYGIML